MTAASKMRHQTITSLLTDNPSYSFTYRQPESGSQPASKSPFPHHNMNFTNINSSDTKLTAPFPLTAEQQRLKVRVQSENARLPRIVFRYWSDTSGGFHGLNTTDAITPGAYSVHNRSEHPSSYFYHLDANYVRRIANVHIGYSSEEHTIFSSWSQSLSTVLGMSHEQPNSHISILDLTLLDKSNVVLHTEQMVRLRLSDISYPDELLAFGVISGPAYQAVLRSDFDRLTTPLRRNPKDPAIATIREALLSLFRHKFRPAVAAHCIAFRALDFNHFPEEAACFFSIIGGLTAGEKRMTIPSKWKDDPRIMELGDSFLLQHDSSRAALLAAFLIHEAVLRSTLQDQLREQRRWDKELEILRGDIRS